MVETTEMAIKSMDSQLRNVLSGTPEADRGKLISVCLKSIPDRMNFVEFVTFVSAISKMGFVDINNISNDQIDFSNHNGPFEYYLHSAGCGFTIDTDGRITELRKITYGDYDLPAIIVFLERLTCLTLYDCRSLPVELSNLPHLKELDLHIFSSDLHENFPIQMKLNNLEKLVVHSNSFLPASSRLLKWMTSQLPGLETLDFWGFKRNDFSFIIDSLRTNDVCFHNSLKHLTLCCCKMEEESFEILMLEIVPKFRDLKSLYLNDSNIKSFLPIVDSIKNSRTFVPSKSLRVLGVRSNNPVFKKMKDDPSEKAALLSLLRTFNTIHNLGGFDVKGYGWEGGRYDSDVEYALRINHAGRRIVVKVDGGSNNDDNDGKAIVPISLWPVILERAYEKSLDIYDPPFEEEDWMKKKKKKKNATGIYYLLREVGPALLSGGQRRPNASILSKDGGGGVSLKRKDTITINERISETRNNNNNKSSSSSSPSKRSCYGK